MANEDLLYIEDANNRRLYYRFTPAALISNFVPLVVILHDEKGAGAHHFEYKMWSVLTPIHNIEDEKGLCWLGEKEDYYVKDLLQELISQITEEYECEDHIYLYGKGIGGYGAILHGILSDANAVYAHTPQLRLRGIETKENDLINFLNPKDTFPIFYLCKSESSDETASFVETCKKYKIKVDLDHCPKSKNDEEAIKEVLNFLERMISQG